MMSDELANQVASNWLAEAEAVKAAVKGFRWPDEMSFSEAVLHEIDRLRRFNHLSEVFRIVEGATRGDMQKVRNYAGLLADKLDEDGEADSARWLRQIVEGKAGARIVAHANATDLDKCPKCGKERPKNNPPGPPPVPGQWYCLTHRHLKPRTEWA